MASKTKKAGAKSPGKATVIEESDEEMRNLATSLQRGLALAVKARELLGEQGKKPSKAAIKKLHAITEEIANAPPPPLSSEWEG